MYTIDDAIKILKEEGREDLLQELAEAYDKSPDFRRMTQFKFGAVYCFFCHNSLCTRTFEFFWESHVNQIDSSKFTWVNL